MKPPLFFRRTRLIAARSVFALQRRKLYVHEVQDAIETGAKVIVRESVGGAGNVRRQLNLPSVKVVQGAYLC